MEKLQSAESARCVHLRLMACFFDDADARSVWNDAEIVEQRFAEAGEGYGHPKIVAAVVDYAE